MYEAKPFKLHLVLARIHGCSFTDFNGKRRSGCNTNSFAIKCSAAFDIKSGILYCTREIRLYVSSKLCVWNGGSPTMSS